MKRVFVIVLDSFGIGEEPDAALFGDAGVDTLRSVSTSDAFFIPNLISLGLGNIDGVNCIQKVTNQRAATLRLREMSRGKDTTIGHWELMGVVSPEPLPTYPDGFPEEVVAAFTRTTGYGVLCNKPYSGTEVIRDYGEAHLATGKLILYTSADSVFQIAAHEDLVPPEKLYEICRAARSVLTGKHAVGRVIARPFVGTAGKFTRTANRRDFSLIPPQETLLDALCAAGREVISVGKISDIFASRGITESHPTHGNAEGMAEALALAERDFSGLCFVNLVDFDTLYGHRQDTDGYAKALSAFDAWLPVFLEKLGEDDLLVITADHGCDPADSHTDHTREYVPCLLVGEKIRPGNYGTRTSFSDLAQTLSDFLSAGYRSRYGKSFADLLR